MAQITRKHESKVETPDRNGLTAAEVKPWFDGLPPHARITAITRDVGDQRDPWIVTAGLRATWEER